MRNRGLLNPFSQETKELFNKLGFIHCWDCLRSDKGAELHHILGRKSNSPYNGIPLCRDCHDKVYTDKQEKILKYLNKTFNYLEKIKYKPTKKDKEFLEQRSFINKINN